MLVWFILTFAILVMSNPPVCPSNCNGCYLPHPTNCSKYYICSNGVATEMECPSNLQFNFKLDVCDYDYIVNCYTSTTTGTTSSESPITAPADSTFSETTATELPTSEPTTTSTEILTTTASPTTTTTTEATTTQTTTTEPPTTTTTETTTSSSPSTSTITTTRGTTTKAPPITVCPDDTAGKTIFLPFVGDCSKYVECCDGKTKTHSCPPGYEFYYDLQVCDDPEIANCPYSSRLLDIALLKSA